MLSPTGIMPEDLINRSRREQAFEWLLAQPLPGRQKTLLWQGWANTVGSGASPRELTIIEDSGIDQPL